MFIGGTASEGPRISKTTEKWNKGQLTVPILLLFDWLHPSRRISRNTVKVKTLSLLLKKTLIWVNFEKLFKFIFFLFYQK